jgi:hypothetical protein
LKNLVDVNVIENIIENLSSEIDLPESNIEDIESFKNVCEDLSNPNDDSENVSLETIRTKSWIHFPG